MTLQEWDDRKEAFLEGIDLILEAFSRRRGRRPQKYYTLEEIAKNPDVRRSLTCLNFEELETNLPFWRKEWL